MTVGFGINPEPLYQAGRSVSELQGDASSASTKFTSSLTDGSAAVKHAKLQAALSKYNTTWSASAKQLPLDVTAAGNGISNAATAGVQGDNQAAADMTPAFCTAQGNQSLMQRPIQTGG